jgi:antitoxin ParD1/3/4
MPTRNVNLTDALNHFVRAKVKSGRYENASEVVRAALRTLEREEQLHEANLAALRSALDEGDASGIAKVNVFERAWKNLKLPSTRLGPWLGSVFRAVPKPARPISAIIPFAVGEKLKRTGISDSFKIVASSLLAIPHSAASVMKSLLGYGRERRAAGISYSPGRKAAAF